MRSRIWILLSVAMASPALAQIGPIGQQLPGVAQPVERVLGGTLESVDRTLGTGVDATTRTVRGAAALAQARIDRIGDLVRRNPAAIERDADGNPARKGELLLVAPDQATLDAARQLGFAVMAEERLDTLDISVTRLSVPRGMTLARAQALLRKAAPDATVSADTLNFPSGSAAPARGREGKASPPLPPVATPVGVIDGAPGRAIPVEAVRGFAPGAPAPGDHGSAVVSLLRRAGVQRVLVADVYGAGPAGGNALAIAQGMDWLMGRGVRVISISLVGPANGLLARTMDAAQRRGAVIVAAVGNDGPAAPPAYPASYPGVLAVTGVDGRNRALIEAGRARHLDYAAPGADMRAMNAAGRLVPVRGTSFATPLVAARAANAMDARAALPAALDREAIDLGARGPDAVYGRGLICTICR
ncbi:MULTISPECIES: S8 family serine peptidase [unclassified Novosphingobium]|uniref:S8 family serine peptidase n=1 Tax=unclassified Novosphingobium TaxID=2644732 RepID=UPI00086BC7F1|nr:MULTISPECIES: S8 family serine peptidase [unclassified Novosphingobium]MBF5092694.1 S8 family serine peptidase [Novosphingobium sp. NBM11]ODU72196.1 MAG: peptidase S8 [Novosphingobium sp. SCN 66-18]RQW45031.1 peptidase S8 [Novosphingobium sp. LASN5T]